MMLSICISTRNRPVPLEKLKKSIKDYTRMDHEVVIYDDTKQKSIPVAEAWNVCAKQANGDFLVFLNDDMEVLPNWDTDQLAFWEGCTLPGSLAFKVVDDRGHVQSRGHSFNGTTPYLPDEDALVVDYSDHPFTTKRNWERVGGFTTHGHLYYEDADFGLKLRNAGLFTYYNRKARLIHNTIGLRVGSDDDKRTRKHNESVIQQQSKLSFLKSWSNFLNLKSG